jgi:GNAT superfamily N-acetyltransferase
MRYREIISEDVGGDEPQTIDYKLVRGQGGWEVVATVNGECIGSAIIGQHRYRPDAYSVMNVWVNDEYRRRGVATAMYDFAYRHGFAPLYPDQKQSHHGQAFWHKAQMRAFRLGKPMPPMEWGKLRGLRKPKRQAPVFEAASVPGILYHGTGCLRAANILADNHLKQFTWDGGPKGVSFAHEQSAAEYFAIRSDTEDAARYAFVEQTGQPPEDFEYDATEAWDDFPHLKGIVFEFMTRDLAQRHKIAPYDYDHHDPDGEAEWRLHTHAGIESAQDHLRAIYGDPRGVQWWIEQAPRWGLDARVPGLLALLAHPLFRSY